MEAESKRAFASLQFRSFHRDYNPGEQRSNRFSVDERVPLKNFVEKTCKKWCAQVGGAGGWLAPPRGPIAEKRALKCPLCW